MIRFGFILAVFALILVFISVTAVAFMIGREQGYNEAVYTNFDADSIATHQFVVGGKWFECRLKEDKDDGKI